MRWAAEEGDKGIANFDTALCTTEDFHTIIGKPSQ